ncbi:MAG: hypothetical protein M3361_13385 [Candidatus Tectomicrobia bacterium]|nr:hypothetical protein [Candidatus Tectomicrobia bacterium]
MNPAQPSNASRQQPPLPRALNAGSKYELNLAEFPLVILSKQRPKGLKVMEYQDTKVKIIQYEDTIHGKDGELVPRRWTVIPSLRYGFGSPQLVSLLFELFQIWKEQGFASPQIRFGSIANLVKRQGLTDTDTRAFQRNRKDLRTLTEVTIDAENAFWDNELGAYVDATFHLFDRVYFYHKEADNKQRMPPFAYIEASKELWESVQANALTTLKLTSTDFHNLTPTEQRLALYLVKMLHHKTLHRRDVQKLAEQLPIYAKRYKDVKKQLTRACDGLLTKKFPHLTTYQYEAKHLGQGENIVFYKKTLERMPKRSPSDKESVQVDDTIEEILSVTGDQQNEPWYRLIAQKLDYDTIYMALSETKYAYHERQIRKTKAQYFTDTIKRAAERQGIILNPKRR